MKKFIYNFNDYIKYNKNGLDIEKIESLESCSLSCLIKFPWINKNDIYKAIIKIVIKHKWNSTDNNNCYGIECSYLLEELHKDYGISININDSEICSLLQIIKNIDYIDIYAYRLRGTRDINYLLSVNEQFLIDAFSDIYEQVPKTNTIKKIVNLIENMEYNKTDEDNNKENDLIDFCECNGKCDGNCHCNNDINEKVANEEINQIDEIDELLKKLSSYFTADMTTIIIRKDLDQKSPKIDIFSSDK